MADQAAQRVERFIKERRATNEILVSWPLYYFVLSWLTLGIYPIVVWWKRVARADAFRDRKEAYYNALIEYTSQRAEGAGRLDAVHNELADLSGEVKVAFNDRMRPINPGLSLALTI